jgi:hypothetical protein
LAPFECSANVAGLPELSVYPPTAIQLDDDEHDTALKVAPRKNGVCGPGGSGTDCRLHLDPFHRSASRDCEPELPTDTPTATHAEDEGHDTLDRALAAAPGGFGVDSLLQLVPFHRSAKLTPVPEPSTEEPTAMHMAASGHDTENSCPVGASGFGMGTLDQPGPAAPAGTARVTKTAAAPTTTRSRLREATSRQETRVITPPPSRCARRTARARSLRANAVAT